MPPFIPGLTLCGDFYREAVYPILDDAFPGLPHSAALIGSEASAELFDRTYDDYRARLAQVYGCPSGETAE